MTPLEHIQDWHDFWNQVEVQTQHSVAERDPPEVLLLSVKL